MVSDNLRRFVRRAEDDPFFVARRLRRCREEHGVGPEELAELLGLPRDEEALVSLALCRAPDTPAEALRIARYSGADGRALEELLGFPEIRGSGPPPTDPQAL